MHVQKCFGKCRLEIVILLKFLHKFCVSMFNMSPYLSLNYTNTIRKINKHTTMNTAKILQQKKT